MSDPRMHRLNYTQMRHRPHAVRNPKALGLVAGLVRRILSSNNRKGTGGRITPVQLAPANGKPRTVHLQTSVGERRSHERETHQVDQRLADGATLHGFLPVGLGN